MRSSVSDLHPQLQASCNTQARPVANKQLAHHMVDPNPRLAATIGTELMQQLHVCDFDVPLQQRGNATDRQRRLPPDQVLGFPVHTSCAQQEAFSF
eukprot:3048660-Amphidinium_carterae.1